MSRKIDLIVLGSLGAYLLWLFIAAALRHLASKVGMRCMAQGCTQPAETSEAVGWTGDGDQERPVYICGDHIRMWVSASARRRQRNAELLGYPDLHRVWPNS